MKSEKTLTRSCGTISGYTFHLKNKKKTCEPCRAAHRIYAKRWVENNPEKIKKYSYKRDSSSIKKWKEENREKHLGHKRKRRALKFNSQHEFYTEQQVLELYGNLCHLCGIIIDLNASRQAGKGNWQYGLHIDHVIPLSKGGADNLQNVRPSHGKCNLQKGDKVS